MAYMIMLVADDIDQLNEILEAWTCIHIDDVVFVDSTCFHRSGKKPPHIPMRFMFENLGRGGQRQCSVTLFGIVADEATVQQCITVAETIVGDFENTANAMLAAWPLPIVKGFPKNKARQEGCE